MNPPGPEEGSGQQLLAREPVIRRAGAGDRELTARFLASLSPETRYLRFMSCVSPPRSWLRILSGEADGTVVVVAVDGEVMVGHAMAARPAAGGTPDVGVVVADSHQGRGVGRALVEELARCLSLDGIREITVRVLASNTRAQAMISRCWPQASWDWSDGAEAKVTVPLWPAGGPREPA